MKETYKQKVDGFLNLKNIAVAGYSNEKKQPANYIYEKLNQSGFKVFAVNPKNEAIKDVNCFTSLRDIQTQIDGIVICTPPSAVLDIVRTCKELSINYIWMHRSFDVGSYSAEAERFCDENGIVCISSGCPMMFLKADLAHKCMKWVLDWTGKLK